MKSSDRLPSITAPLLKDTLNQDKLNQIAIQEKIEEPDITTSGVTQPAELDQDPGGGFNPNHDFPQQ
jgi:hypothetical protein